MKRGGVTGLIIFSSLFILILSLSLVSASSNSSNGTSNRLYSSNLGSTNSSLPTTNNLSNNSTQKTNINASTSQVISQTNTPASNKISSVTNTSNRTNINTSVLTNVNTSTPQVTQTQNKTNLGQKVNATLKADSRKITKILSKAETKMIIQKKMGPFEVKEISLIKDEGIYSMIITQDSKLFFLFPVKKDISTRINATTGEIIKTKKPWWGILTVDVMTKIDICTSDEECDEGEICISGKCIHGESSLIAMESCFDSDGGRYEFIYGEVEKSDDIYKDNCRDSMSLIEKYCDKGKMKEETISCKNGCSNGKCNMDFSPGQHTELWIGEGDFKTEVIYYIPENFDSSTAEYWFLIHGADVCSRKWALNYLDQWVNLADKQNLVLIAPVFDRIYYKDGVRIDDPDFCINVFAGEYGFEGTGVGCFNSVEECLDSERHYTSSQCAFYETYSCKNHLRDFINLLNSRDEQRLDKKTFEIFHVFKENLMFRDKFNLYGHSGGGQFTSRFMMIYPEFLDKVGVSAAGTFTFPQFDHCYPYSLDMSLIDGPIVSDPDYLSDLNLCGGFKNVEEFYNFKLITQNQFKEKIKKLLGLKVLIVMGAEDEVGNCHENRAGEWQGCYDWEKAINFYGAMNQTAIDLGKSIDNLHLEILPGVGHDYYADGEFAKMFFYADSCEEDTDCATGEECKDGFCAPKSCSDTDVYYGNSANPFDLGTAKGIAYDTEEYTEGTDYCIDRNNVMEFYCGSGTKKVYNAALECEGGCVNGACVETITPSCVELNPEDRNPINPAAGGNYYLKGTSNGIASWSEEYGDYTDFCLNPKTLIEYYCDISDLGKFVVGGSGESWDQYDCSHEGKVCNNGACV